MSSAKPSSSYVCTKCGKEHAFPAYVYAHWDMEVIHTCDCGAKHVLLRGVARVQATAAEPDAQVVGRLPRGVSTALRGMTRHQLEDVLDGAYGFSCYDDVMGMFTWKTADTGEVIPTIYDRSCRKVYLLQPDGQPAIEQDGYEGYGVFGGVDALVWLARRNLPPQRAAKMSEQALRTAGIALMNDFEIVVDRSGVPYTVWHPADAVVPEIEHLGVNWNAPIERFGGRCANDLLRSGDLRCVPLLEFRPGLRPFPLKFSFDAHARYEDLPASEEA